MSPELLVMFCCNLQPATSASGRRRHLLVSTYLAQTRQLVVRTILMAIFLSHQAMLRQSTKVAPSLLVGMETPLLIFTLLRAYKERKKMVPTAIRPAIWPSRQITILVQHWLRE